MIGKVRSRVQERDQKQTQSAGGSDDPLQPEGKWICGVGGLH